ncbi:MAG: 2-phosphosulfolactate phosphatase [Desulfobacteraceae bacterium]|nr:2-phosphosulfolactate phosphatase [Desulfobacteraceae bacterium]MBU3948985.1 2-phosphosulfolactate phosphatase [Pseudomonadota bacterium]MBU4055887.1 2-phosphosulfolactate phosphatase [Pseudomonadota bacterium]
MFDIRILQQSREGVKAEGLTVIIDVFRAFTTACCFIERGAKRLIPLADAGKAYDLKQHNPDFFFAGERAGEKLPEADFGNSPSKAIELDLKGRTVVFTTSAGTQGFQAAVGASELVSGSFCNAGAIVRYIQKQNPDSVSLMCMGHRDIRPSDEDTLCAEYICRALNGERMSRVEIRARLRISPDAKKFFDSDIHWASEADFDFCTDVDRFDFILKYAIMDGLPELRPITVSC